MRQFLPNEEAHSKHIFWRRTKKDPPRIEAEPVGIGIAQGQRCRDRCWLQRRTAVSLLHRRIQRAGPRPHFTVWRAIFASNGICRKNRRIPSDQRQDLPRAPDAAQARMAAVRKRREGRYKQPGKQEDCARTFLLSLFRPLKGLDWQNPRGGPRLTSPIVSILHLSLTDRISSNSITAPILGSSRSRSQSA